MNEMSDIPRPEKDDEPAIVLLGIDRNNYYVYKGDEFLNQMLLVDGVYPKPIFCMHFESVFDASLTLGEGFSLANLWAIHPEILKRLRNEGCLIEESE